MTFSRAVIPLIRLNCWKMNPKVDLRTSVRNLSGRLVISRSATLILPEVGLAMQPIIPSSVVFPEPLGPLMTVILRDSMLRVISRMATCSFDFPWLKILHTFRSAISMSSPHYRIGIDRGRPPGRDDGGHGIRKYR